MTELEDAVRGHRETTRVDYKERLNWYGGPAMRAETLRDIAGFANRDGGMIIVGIHDNGDATYRNLGLQDDDRWPDPSDIGHALREAFDPTVEVVTGRATVDGIEYGYIVIPAFSISPLIATRDVGDPAQKRSILADGDLVVRSDALATEKVKARDLRAMLDRAVSRRAAMFAAELPPRLPPPADEPSWGAAAPGTRLLDLRPEPSPAPLRLLELEDAIKAARVQSSFGMVFMPAEFDEYGSHVIRETGRLIIQAREQTDRDERVSTAEVTSGLAVRVREVPWEARDADTPPTVDVTSLVVFVMASTLFAHRLYEGRNVQICQYRVGLASPQGLRLSVNAQSFWSLSEAHVATSRTDVWVMRDVEMASISTPDQRRAFNDDVLRDVFGYFGWRVTDEALVAQINHLRNRGGFADE